MKKIKLGKCEDCKKRKAKIRFSDEPIFAMTHGWGVRNICRQCFIRRLKLALKDIKDNIKKQKELIKNG